MRGRTDRQGGIFYAIQLESLVPQDHFLRRVKRLADEEMKRLAPRFAPAYSHTGRPSIPPEQLIKASLLQALYSIRSERQLCEQIGYNLLYRWFLDMKPDDRVWDPTTFTQNRERFHEHGLMQAFFDSAVARSIQEEAVSVEHYSVDGSLIQSFASIKSFRPKEEKKPPKDPGNGWVDFHGERRSNETHESKTDPEAKLFRKGPGHEAKLSHSIHALMENRNGLLMAMEVEHAGVRIERDAALSMLKRLRRRHGIWPKTLAADKGYDAGEFLLALEREHGLIPHVAIRQGAIRAQGEEADARRRARKRQKTLAYRLSYRTRPAIEKIFAWLKEIAGLDRTRFARRWKTKLYGLAAGAAYNLMRLARLPERAPTA